MDQREVEPLVVPSRISLLVTRILQTGMEAKDLRTQVQRVKGRAPQDLRTPTTSPLMKRSQVCSTF
jgi:hypothetical protein